MRLRACLLLSGAGWLHGAHALDPSTPLDAYHRQAWTTEAGAPPEVGYIAQAADGWLWLAALTGLYRFDGIKFERFQPRSGEHLLGAGITVLLPRANGDLWIGYQYGGLSVLHDGHLRHVAAVPGKPLGTTYALAVDDTGTAWVASTTGFWRYRRGAWTRVDTAAGMTTDGPSSVYHDQYGRLFFNNGRKVYLYDSAGERFTAVTQGGSLPGFLGSPDGRVWTTSDEGVRLLPAPPGGWRPRPPESVRFNIRQKLFDRDGNYWAGGCPDGLCVRRPESIPRNAAGFPNGAVRERFVPAGRMSSVAVHALMEDREGNVWIGTNNGLERLRDNTISTVPHLPAWKWPAFAIDRTGRVWLSAISGSSPTGRLWYLRDGKPVEPRPTRQYDLVASGAGGTVLAAAEDRIERRAGDRVLATYPLPPTPFGTSGQATALLLAEDRNGLWLYQSARGLFRWQDGKWAPPSAHPHLGDAVYVATGADGRTWFGTRTGGVIVADGPRWHRYGAADGVPPGPVTFVHAGADLLVSGDSGMAVYRNGRFLSLHAERADLARLSGVVAAPDGDRWLSTTGGLLHVRAADWQRSMADPGTPLRGELLDKARGFPGLSDPQAATPNVAQAPDGTLWFVGTRGLGWLDPGRLRRQPAAPAVALTALAAGGRPYRPDAIGALPAGTTRLQFNYTALSYAMPERIRFRYRLAGADDRWQEAGTARTAQYTNLGPGRYRFEVGAVGDDGTTGPVAGTGVFEILPLPTQTRWFAGLCTLAAGAAAGLLLRLRVAGIRRRMEARMAVRMRERERIARTLHDTFLQNVQALILRMDGIAGSLPAGAPQRGPLEQLMKLAQDTVIEGRGHLLDLRANTYPVGLHRKLEELAALLAPGAGTQASIVTAGEPAELAADVAADVYGIAAEALTNAYAHAHARRIDVVLDWRGGGLYLAVHDDGTGFADGMLVQGRAGHWGLQGMRERAHNLGAQLTMRDSPHGGAEVSLRLPLRTRHSRWRAGLRSIFRRYQPNFSSSPR